MNIYEIVTNSLIERVETMIANGETANWLCPWQRSGLPKSYITEKTYSGINLWLLESGYFLTWNQYLDIKKKMPEVQLKKGSKSHICVYFNYNEIEDEETGETKKVPFLKYYRLFNSDDFENLPPKEKLIEYEHGDDKDISEFISAYSENANVRVTVKKSNRAYYSPLFDEIVLPKESQFKVFDDFVSTTCHEIIHSTGHKTRLDRLKENFKEDEAYSKEELVAQMGSSLLCYLLGYENTDTTNNDINYIRGWLSHLKDNVRELVSAGALAQKAVDYVMNTVYQTA
ncbi:MAG: DUF1738 domain-containing protein [Clostridia bacterium]|nr:DUF1738 domain-containing protein [Clostridia bacterium]